MKGRQREPAVADIPHAVYIAYTEEGSALYVGMSNGVEERIYQHHLRYAAWTWDYAYIDIWEVGDRAEARALERDAIQALRPRDNVYDNPAATRRPRQAVAS